jgi:hypothetical protein
MKKTYRSGGYNKNAQFRCHIHLLQKPKLAIAHKNSTLVLPGQTENQQICRRQIVVLIDPSTVLGTRIGFVWVCFGQVSIVSFSL